MDNRFGDDRGDGAARCPCGDTFHPSNGSAVAGFRRFIFAGPQRNPEPYAFPFLPPACF